VAGARSTISVFRSWGSNPNGDVTMTGNPIKLAGYSVPDVRRGAPGLDKHRAAVRQEFTGTQPIRP
jgi:hypothetical protein